MDASLEQAREGVLHEDPSARHAALDFEDAGGGQAFQGLRDGLHAKQRLGLHLLVARVEPSALGIEEVKEQGAQDREARLADGAVAFAGQLGPAFERFRCGNDSRSFLSIGRRNSPKRLPLRQGRGWGGFGLAPVAWTLGEARECSRSG
jgi:hypothetical protein